MTSKRVSYAVTYTTSVEVPLVLLPNGEWDQEAMENRVRRIAPAILSNRLSLPDEAHLLEITDPLPLWDNEDSIS